MISHTTILGVKITTSPKPDLLAFIVNYLKSQSASPLHPRSEANWRTKPLKIYTPNPEQIVLANEQPEFGDLLNTADINLPDGVGLEWAAKLVRSSKLEVGRDKNNLLRTTNSKLQTLTRISGIDFMEDLIKLAIFLYNL